MTPEQLFSVGVFGFVCGFFGFGVGTSVDVHLFRWLTELRRLQHEEHMVRLKLEAEREKLLFESTQWHAKEPRK